MHRILILVRGLVFASAAMAQDPIKTDGDKYKVLLEIDKVRASSTGIVRGRRLNGIGIPTSFSTPSHPSNAS